MTCQVCYAMDFDILPASLRDLGGLHKLEHACFKQDAWPLLDLVAVLTFPGILRLKAVIGDEMVGFIAGDIRRSDGMAWIATIGVIPACRRQGIARALLCACEQQLSTLCIRLSVRASNEAAIRLYEREGYRTIDIWRRYYDGGEDAIVMENARQPNVL